MYEDSKEFKSLMKAMNNAQIRVNTILLRSGGGTIYEFRNNVNEALNRLNTQVEEAVAKWGTKDLQDSFEEGVKFTETNVPQAVAPTAVNLPKEKILNAYVELTQKSKIASDNARRIVNEAIEKLEEQGGVATVFKVKGLIKDALLKENNNAMTVQYSNGARVNISAYSEMLARTSRIETANTGLINRAEEIGIDLVRCTKIGSTCPICRKYEGKVYSISGNSTKYPPLYKGNNAPFKNGYNIIHPNCRHEFIPFIEDVYSEKELKDIQKESNQFTDYTGKEKIFTQYNKDQAMLQQLRSEEIAYNKMKQELGNNMPYKTLGAFRRASRADSSTFKEAKQEVIAKLGARNSTYRSENAVENLLKQNKTVIKNIDLDDFVSKRIKNIKDKNTTLNSLKNMSRFNSNSDTYLYNEMDKKGFAGKPIKLSKEDFNKLEDDNFIKVYRGISKSDDIEAIKMVDEFKNGKLYCGKGLFGNGTYTAGDLEIAQSYGDDIIDIAIPKNINIVDYKEIKEISDKLNMDFCNNKYNTVASESGGYVSNYISRIFDDVSKTAVEMNYDVIKVDPEYFIDTIPVELTFKPKPYYIILNRSKIIVKE